jgi:hypothetical protein
MLAPTGSTVDTTSLGLGDLDVNPQEAKPAGEGFVLEDYARSTLLDPGFAEYQRRLEQGRETGDTTGFKADDTMSSSFVMKLPNGNQLVVVPDIRVGDIAAIQHALKAELNKLGSDVQFRLWDMTHHMQAGFVGSKEATKADAIKPGEVHLSGGLPLSRLVQLTEMLSSLTSKAAKGTPVIDAVAVSVDPGKVDPGLVWILRSCGLEVFTAQNKQDVQFIEATTAAGRKMWGTTSKPYPGMGPSDPLLRRTADALDALRSQLEVVARDYAQNRSVAKKEIATKRADRQALAKQRKALRRAVDARQTALDAPGKRQVKTPLADRQDALADAQQAFQQAVDALAQIDGEIADIRARGEARAPDVKRLTDQVKAIETARKAYLEKIDSTIGKSVHQIEKPSVAPEEGGASPFQAEELALKNAVDPVYSDVKADAAGATPRLEPIGETTLIILGKGAQTEAGSKLHAERMEIEKLRDRIAASDRPLEAHGELIGKLTDHIKDLEASPEHNAAIDDEVAFLKEQLAESQKAIQAAVDKGTKTVDRDPATGAIVKTSIIVEKTAEQAAAKPTAFDPEAAGAAKRGKLMKQGMDVFGRAMGGVMIYQNVIGGVDELTKYADDKAGGAATAVGVAKSAYGINIGYRMLSGAHVGMPEFVILSILDVTETALKNYASTEEWNTEVTYSVIRNTVSLACAALGGYIVEGGIATGNPLIVAAGLVVMFLGDPILEALGIKGWLAKKFDWRPDEYIDLESDLAKLIAKYTAIVGAIELAERDDASLAKVNAADPVAVRRATAQVIASRMDYDITGSEREILGELDAAYDRAREGYAELREIDELRQRFLDLYSKVHADDESVQGEPTVMQVELDAPLVYYGPVTTKELDERLAAQEATIGPDNSIPVGDIETMEQWTKMDGAVNALEFRLYAQQTPGMIDWQAASEAERNLAMMIDNAHYRLDPAAQGNSRLTPLFPDTPEGLPARAAYQHKLDTYENKLDVLRQRTVQVAHGDDVPMGALPMDQQDAIYERTHSEDVSDYTYSADYGDVSRTRQVDELVDQAQRMFMDYRQLLESSGELPSSIGTVEALYSNPDVIGSYEDKALNDERYSALLYKLKASELAVTSQIKRVAAAAQGRSDLDVTTANGPDILIAELRQASEYRRIEKGFLFFEEVPAVASRIAAARLSKMAAALHEDPTAAPLTDEEQAAAKTDELKRFDLGTLSQRLASYGIQVPMEKSPSMFRYSVPGVYSLAEAPSVLVVSTNPMYRDDYSHSLYDGAIDPRVPIKPLNAAAVAYFGGTDETEIAGHELRTVSLEQLQEMTGTKP